MSNIGGKNKIIIKYYKRNINIIVSYSFYYEKKTISASTIF